MFHNRRKYYRPPRRRSVSWGRPTARLGRSHSNYDLPDINQQAVKRFVLAVFFGAAFCWFFYFFLISDSWAIKKVQIAGLASIPEQELRLIVGQEIGGRRFFVLPNNNILLFSKNSLSKRVQKKYIMEEIAIDKELPGTLNITVKEKQARLVLKSVSKMEIKNETAPETANGETATSTPAITIVTSTIYYFLDVNGIVVGQYTPPAVIDENAPRLPMVEIETSSQTLVKPGDIALGSEEIGYVFAVYEAIARSGAGIKLESVIYNPQVNDEMKFVTTEGWQGLLSKKLSLDTQMRKLELALSEKVKDKRRSLQYVDLRVKDRVYFK